MYLYPDCDHCTVFILDTSNLKSTVIYRKTDPAFPVTCNSYTLTRGISGACKKTDEKKTVYNCQDGKI
jgi:hypothetical protein